MDERQKKVQEAIMLDQQLAILRGENIKLKSQVNQLYSSIKDENVSQMTTNELKVDIQQCQKDKLNLEVAIDNKTQQIMELEMNIIEARADKEAEELNLVQLRQMMRCLKTENDLIRKEIQNIRCKLREQDLHGDNPKIKLELEGKPPMSIMMDQLEAEVQRLSDKLSSLPDIALENVDVDEQMIKHLREQLHEDESKIKTLEDEIKQLEAENAEFEFRSHM